MEKQLVYVGRLFGVEIWAMMNEPRDMEREKKAQLIRGWFYKATNTPKPKPVKNLPGQMDLEEELNNGRT